MIYNERVEYKSNSNMLCSCKYHAVFCPKYRRPVLKSVVHFRLKELIKKTCTKLSVGIIEMEIILYHVHLLIEVYSQFGVHKEVIGKQKGY